ncbi:MAG: membrane protein insertase YidC, partial [Alphaproteobacteria bacterium]
MSSEDTRNAIIAFVLFMGVLILYQTLFETPGPEQRPDAAQTEQTAQPGTEPADNGLPAPQAAPQNAPGRTDTEDSGIPRPAAAPRAEPGASAEAVSTAGVLNREAALALSPRVPIRSEAVTGSIALKGGIIDDLRLRRYRETVEEDSPIITLLSPLKARGGYSARFGWVAGGGGEVALPDENTMWRQAGSGALTPGNPVILQWDNGQGLMFERRISIDEDYMFTVTERVVNSGDRAVTLHPYGLITRHDVVKEPGFGILHIGMIGALKDELQTYSYDKIKKQDKRRFEAESEGGWVGITDKYWLTALAPTEQAEPFTGRFLHRTIKGRDAYQADYVLTGRTIPPGKDVSVDTQLFAGAKKVNLIDGYKEQYGITKFDYAVDWGWFPFLTRPFFSVLDWITDYVGNFGVAILLFTVLVKIAFFWFSQKAYVSMAKMKKVQPKMKKLQERYKDDKT